MSRLRFCYGGLDKIREVSGDTELLDEFATAMFTAAAIDYAAPHDCSEAVWLGWVESIHIADDGHVISQGGGGCGYSKPECGVCPMTVAGAGGV